MKGLKRLLTIIVSFLAMFAFLSPHLFLPVETRADVGPKPYTEITIRNLKQSDYIASYAVRDDYQSGPHSHFSPDIETAYLYGKKEDLTIVYNNVALPEGWSLYDISSFHKETTGFVLKSGYYWPQEFILIIYDKVSSDYYLSTETKTYAFSSYFFFDMNDYDYGAMPLSGGMKLKQSYDYTKEILGFFLRLAVTLAIEMLLALAFRFDKKSLLIIGITNATTQILLNVCLNITAYFSGKNPLLIPFYIMAELAIIAVEATIYKLLCQRGESKTKRWNITYAILANVLSFSAGMFIWILM